MFPVSSPRHYAVWPDAERTVASKEDLVVIAGRLAKVNIAVGLIGVA